jgi:hypothetical protein
MADLPGILKDVKELNNKYSYEPTSHILDFNIDPNLDVNGNVDDTLSDTCRILLALLHAHNPWLGKLYSAEYEISKTLCIIWAST